MKRLLLRVLTDPLLATLIAVLEKPQMPREDVKIILHKLEDFFELNTWQSDFDLTRGVTQHILPMLQVVSMACLAASYLKCILDATRPQDVAWSG